MVGVWLPDGSGVAPSVVRAGSCCFRLVGLTHAPSSTIKGFAKNIIYATRWQPRPGFLLLLLTSCFSHINGKMWIKRFHAQWVWSQTVQLLLMRASNQLQKKPAFFSGVLCCKRKSSCAPRLPQQLWFLWWILQGLSRWTPSHEKAYAWFVVWRRGFLTLTHFMLPLPTLSVCVCLIFSGLYPPVTHTPTWRAHMLVKVYGLLKGCTAQLAYLG